MSAKTINLTIDGVAIQAPAGSTIMDAAQTLGIHIPRLCYHPDLSLEGACRVCIVEVTGMPFYMASCSVKRTSTSELARSMYSRPSLLS